MLDGVSQCWPLAKDCVVWWDAWAAIGAVASAWVGLVALKVSVGAVLATIFLGYMTLNLGVAANKASDAAVALAAREAEIREKRDHDESLILLLRVAGEISDTQTYLRNIREDVAPENGGKEFLESHEVRERVLSEWKQIRFPNYEACVDRLHYLPVAVAGRMARLVGLHGSFDSGIRDEPTPPQEQAAEALAAFELISRLLLRDIDVIQVACMDAVCQLEMDDAKVVAEANKLLAGSAN